MAELKNEVHLQEFEERIKVLNEAKRVLKKGRLLFTVGISKFCNALWAISNYGKEDTFLDDEVFNKMMTKEVSTGVHMRPKEYPYFLTDAYFHTPLSLENEIKSVGFNIIEKCAIEGSIWINKSFDDLWENEKSKESLLNVIRLTEHEDAIMGISPHFNI